MPSLRSALAAAHMLLAMCWLASCTDDPAAPASAGDRTPPEVIAVEPWDGTGGADLDEPLRVHFSEPMDPASATGRVTLAGGTLTLLDWETDRLLLVRHDPFATGTEVTLTVGAELADRAGNSLVADLSVGFLTTSSDLVVMDVTPADGTGDVPVNAGIVLRFSEYLETQEIMDQVVLSDDATPKGSKSLFGFTVRDLRYHTFLLTPDADLPAETTIYVHIPDGLTAATGQTPTGPSTYSFTTGTGADTEPPAIVAVEPANGATQVSPDQGFLRFTFSKSVSRWRLARRNLAFASLTELSVNQVWQWNADYTQLTLGLPSGMPAGTPFDLTYDQLESTDGVANPAPFHYVIKVAGEADYLPYVDGDRFIDLSVMTVGPLDTITSTKAGFARRWTRIDFPTADTMHEVNCFNPNPDGDPFAVPTGAWKAYRRTSGALRWLGWAEETDPPAESRGLDPPPAVLPLPIAVRSWSETAAVTVSGTVTGTIDLLGRVLARQDYVLPERGGQVFVKDAWIVVLDLATGIEGELAAAVRDTIVYAPCFGPVMTVRYEEDHLRHIWRRETTRRWPYDEDGLLNGGYLPEPARGHD